MKQLELNKSLNNILLCGIDEAGRGPVAGPVCAASVILPKNFNPLILNDSKKMTENAREKARVEIMKKAKWFVGWASFFEIDELNIHKASLLAMKRSYEGMIKKYKLSFEQINVCVDGKFCPGIRCSKIKAMPKADTIDFNVMAASILAKTFRDRVMYRYDWIYPEFGYAQHKGYPTKKHIEAIKKYGHSPIQRKSYVIKALG